jgi:type I restriction enzyme S subunit
MNRIDGLIAKLSANEIRFLKLGELEDDKLVKLGRGEVISKMDLSADPGDFPVYSSSAASNGLFGKYGKYMFEDERITWSIDGGGKFFYREPHKYSVTNVCGWLTVLDKMQVNTRYLYYVLNSAWGGRTYNYTVKAHPSVIREDYVIPLPSLEAQIEIVRILDTFKGLEEDLQAELKARYHQQAWIQDYLLRPLSVDEGIDSELISITAAADYIRGLTYSKSAEEQDGPIRVLRANNIDQESNTLNFRDVRGLTSGTKVKKEQKLKSGDILMSTASGSRSHVGKVAYIGEDLDYYFGGFMAVFRAKNGIHPQYLFHILSSRSFQEFLDSAIESTTINNLSASMLEKFMIPVPELETQIEISNKLDLFATFGQNIRNEIAMRNLQFSYYSTKLLAFKEPELV